MNLQDPNPASVGGARGRTQLARLLLLLVLAFAVIAGIWYFQPMAAPVATATGAHPLVHRLSRLAYVTSICCFVANVGHPRIGWHGGLLMWWETIDAYEHGIPVSLLAILPAALCILASVAGHKRRNQLAAWAIGSCGFVLSTLSAHAHWAGS